MDVVAPLADLGQSGDGVGDHGRVRVHEQISQPRDHVGPFDQASIVHVHFGDGDGGGFSDVGVLVLERVAERFDELAVDFGDGDCRHGTQGECANEGIMVVDILSREAGKRLSARGKSASRGRSSDSGTHRQEVGEGMFDHVWS